MPQHITNGFCLVIWNGMHCIWHWSGWLIRKNRQMIKIVKTMSAIVIAFIVFYVPILVKLVVFEVVVRGGNEWIFHSICL